jgi:hypothetical protein
VPWYPRETFGWVAELEAAVPEMRRKSSKCWPTSRALNLMSRCRPTARREAASLLNDARWSAFHLFRMATLRTMRGAVR